MAKKRTKSKVSQASEPTDIVEQTCTHLRKGLEQGNLKKALPEANWNICQDCQTDNKTKESMNEEEEETPSVWLCLKCGHRGCDRNSQEKHALQHYNTPRSDSHCLVLNLDNWSVWCYLCDAEVPYSSSTRLGQLVDYVRKETNKQTCIQSTKLEQEKKELENKKLEKDSKNEKEKVKNFNKHEENAVYVTDTNAEVSVKGFSNLGNTCFFNAVMQNLSQTPVLRQLLKEVKMTGTTVTVESLDSPPNEPWVIKLEQQPGSLTSSMCHFLTDVEETKNGIVTPKELFSQVCKKAIRFRGYQQQDSQELLRYLLDGMRAEEIQRVKVGLIASMNHSAENIEDKEEIKRKANEYEKKRAIPNFVDRIFGGELSSTIMCDECRTVSLVHESFLDLSLPVLAEQAVKKGTVPKHFTISEKKVEDEEEDDDDDNDSYLKEKTESTGTSKHLQKKAKKQAKKQAKGRPGIGICRLHEKIKGRLRVPEIQLYSQDRPHNVLHTPSTSALVPTENIKQEAWQNQRRQNRVINLSELATVKGDPEEKKNCCEEKSQEDPLFEKDNQNQEVEGLSQSVEQHLNLKNVAREENETDASILSERGKSLSQLSESNLTKTEDNLEIVAVSGDNVSGYNSPVLDEGSPPCSDKVSSCLGDLCSEKVSSGLEDGNHHLEMGTFHLEAGESVLIEGRTFLGDENPPCLEKFNPCLVEENRDLREDCASCLENDSFHFENGRPCVKEDNQCVTENSSCLETGRQALGEDSLHLENESQSLCEKTSPDVKKKCPGFEEDSSRLEEGSPCLKEWSLGQEDTDTNLNVRDSSLENKSLCVKDFRPSVEKERHDLGMDCEGMNDIVNDLEKLHLSEATEPGITHSDFIENSPILETKLYEIVNQDPETAFCTLADRKCINTEQCSLESCLYQFTRNEKLSATNKLLCNVCTQTQCNKRSCNVKGENKHVYTNAKKQMLISLAPPILTLHLKRFQQAGVNLQKVNRHIKFPELIDLAPFCTVKCKNVAEGDSKVLYSLYGVVEHSGTMRSGHYTAFVKVRRPNTRLSDLVIHRVVPQGLATEPLKGQWYHISDSHVQTVPLTTVLNSQAYLLFYERIL